MRLHHRAAAIVALLTAVMLALGGGAASALAAPQHSASPQAPTASHAVITEKIVLPQTSIDGPALSSVYGSFEGQSFNKSVIAWTGVDPAHHLSVATSTDGLHFSAARVIDETSPFRPDVTQMGQPQGGIISIAWTGSNPSHSLNVLFDVYGTHPQKLTLWHENSFTAPALLQVNSGLVLAWVGTDANHSLNLLSISEASSGLVPGTKITEPQFSSNAGPHLSALPTEVLTWAARTTLQLSIVNTNFVVLPQTSAYAPSVTSFITEAGPGDWIGWTGTDGAHHLNLQWTTSFPEFPDPASTKTVLGDTALGGPALAFNTGAQIAWTGTDPAHHLNIAKFEFR